MDIIYRYVDIFTRYLFCPVYAQKINLLLAI